MHDPRSRRTDRTELRLPPMVMTVRRVEQAADLLVQWLLPPPFRSRRGSCFAEGQRATGEAKKARDAKKLC